MRTPLLPALAATLALALPAAAQDAAPVYATPQDALDALVAAAATGDAAAAVAAIDPGAADLVQSDDPEATAEALADLAELYRDGFRFVPEGPDMVTIALGVDGWPFPVPLLRGADGWRFDAAAAREELIARRIGGNELDVIDILDAYVALQRDFRSVDQDGDGVMEFASAIISDTNDRDGLYWPGYDSPVGDIAARANLDGFVDTDGVEAAEPFRGYMFRILTEQGPAAPGGAMSYIVNGHMVGGHALLAVPAVYGETGVHTFMVGENGVIHEADLGPDTLAIGFDLRVFDPGEGWSVVEVE